MDRNREERADRFETRAGDIKILHHPDPDIERKAQEYQDKAKKERADQAE